MRGRNTTDFFHLARLFTIAALGFLAGVLLGSLLVLDFAISWPIFVLIFILFLALLFFNFIYKNRIFCLILLFFIFFVTGLVRYSFFDWRNQINLPFGKDLEITGEIFERPQIDATKQTIILKLRKDQNSELFDNSKTGLTFIQISLPHFPAYHYGDLLTIKGKIQQQQNFSDFDYKSYLKRYLIFGLVSNPDSIRKTGSDRSIIVRFIGSLYNFSSLFEQSLNKILPEPHASLAAGLLLGIKRNIPVGLIADLKTDGLTHMIALSGFNVTIIVIVFAESIVAWIGRRMTFILGTLLVLMFVLMTGGAASVIRAAIFSLMILFGRTIGRQGDQTNLMLLAAVIMVAINPYVLRYDLGFQLSFLAFAGLIYLSPIIGNKIKIWLRAWPQFFKATLSETLGAQFAVMPLLFFQFGTISLISPIANLLVVWIVSYSMAAIFIAGALNLVYYPLGKVTAILCWPFLEYIIKMVRWLARLPFASIGGK